MKNKYIGVILLSVLSLSILWLFCPMLNENVTPSASGLPDQNRHKELPEVSNTPSATQAPEMPAYQYRSYKKQKSGLEMSMHVLEIDPSNPKASVLPVTSHDYLFGYDYLSSMSAKHNALAAINGGFSHSDGLPGGLFAKNGELIASGSNLYPALIMAEGQAYISDIKTEICLKTNEGFIDSFYFNKYPKGEGLYVFTPVFGTSNRIETKHLSVVISNGEVQGFIEKSSPVEIPKNGFVVSALDEYSKSRLKKALKPGMIIKIDHTIKTEKGILENYDWGYECGSWILKNRKVVVPKADTWVGTLMNRTPRTAVGIKESGEIVFVVVDGRQKGLSDGLTGTELANELLELGLKDAVFLDGGASSEMIVEGNIVNSPSAGRERKIAVCFVVVNTK